MKKKSSKKVGHTANRKVVHVSFPDDIWVKIKEVAASKGMSASTFVRVASLAAAEK